MWRTRWRGNRREWSQRVGHHHHYQRAAMAWLTWWSLLAPLRKHWPPPPLSLSLSLSLSDQNEELCVCVCGRWFQNNLWVSKWVLSAYCGNGFTKEFWFLAWGWRWKDVWEFSETLSLSFAKIVWIFKEKQQSKRVLFNYLIIWFLCLKIGKFNFCGFVFLSLNFLGFLFLCVHVKDPN